MKPGRSEVRGKAREPMELRFEDQDLILVFRIGDLSRAIRTAEAKGSAVALLSTSRRAVYLCRPRDRADVDCASAAGL